MKISPPDFGANAWSVATDKDGKRHVVLHHPAPIPASACCGKSVLIKDAVWMGLDADCGRCRDNLEGLRGAPRRVPAEEPRPHGDAISKHSKHNVLKRRQQKKARRTADRSSKGRLRRRVADFEAVTKVADPAVHPNLLRKLASAFRRAIS